MAKFATGDVVILVSGSMKMAVESCDDSGVNCVWADGGAVQRATLPEAVLDKYIAPERSSFSRPDGPRGGGDRGGFDKPRRDFGDKPGGGYQGKPPGGGYQGKPRGGFDKPSGGYQGKPGGGAPRKDFGDKPRGGPRRDKD